MNFIFQFAHCVTKKHQRFSPEFQVVTKKHRRIFIDISLYSVCHEKTSTHPRQSFTLFLFRRDIELVVRMEDTTSNRRLGSLNFNLSLSFSLSYCHRVPNGKTLENHPETPIEKQEKEEKKKPRHNEKSNGYESIRTKMQTIRINNELRQSMRTI